MDPVLNLPPVVSAVSADIERAVAALDPAALQKEYWAQDEFLFIPQFLAAAALGPLMADVEQLEPGLNRNYIPGHKKGGSVSHFTIAEAGPALFAFYRSPAFREFLSRLVSADLKLCPADDPHACALYFYTEAGDHMGYHYDTSYYKGARYTVLVGLTQQSSSRLLCRLHTRQPGHEPRDLVVATAPGSMVIFNGDKVYHGVSPSRSGERRVVYTMEYVTNPEMGRAKRLFSNLKDAFAYFGVRSLWQASRIKKHPERKDAPMAANPGSGASATKRVQFVPVEGATELFRPEFLDYLVRLSDEFTPRVRGLRAKRDERLRRALEQGLLPTQRNSGISKGDWQVPPVPEDLQRAGIEISGPCSITSMFINALNPGPEGERAEGDLDDDEDSAGHRLIDTVRAAHNRVAAVNRELSYLDRDKGKEYKIAEGELPFFMHRERGLHLDESELTVDGTPIPAAILGTALTLFYCGRAQVSRGQGIYFYLPKVDGAEEVAWYRDFFDRSREHLPFLEDAVVRAIPLVESLPAVYEMEEMLHALGPYAAGLNAARWDLKASIFEFVMADPKSVWPDRFGVDIKTTPFLANIFRRLVAVCLKRGAAPIGGMATALPSSDPEVNRVAAESIKADKEWEAQQGFIRAWVAHIFHMKVAGDPFKRLRASGWKPTPAMTDPDNYPIRIEVPEGPITVDGTRRNARMLIEYLEGWLTGRGAKGIDSLAGKPGVHPALMEDLATGRMSVAQIAQRIRHRAPDTKDPNKVHDFALVRRLLYEEVDDILVQLKGPVRDDKGRAGFAEAERRYRKAVKIAMRWIKNYTDLDFRSLGSYTPADLDSIAAAPDAF